MGASTSSEGDGSKKKRKVKVCFFGASRSGKSTVVGVLEGEDHDDTYISTDGLLRSKTNLGPNLRVSLWDCGSEGSMVAEQDRRDIEDAVERADVAFLCYDPSHSHCERQVTGRMDKVPSHVWPRVVILGVLRPGMVDVPQAITQYAEDNK
ncbi:hypothetical protein KIPB_009298, partial [Kipferlia bialata]|eukprot:g9298.t1